MMKAYHIASRVVAPLVPLWLKVRLGKGKEHPARMNERLGHASYPRPEGKLLWIHAASVGESLSVLPLLEPLLLQHPGHQILITTVTVTSAEILASKLPLRAIHQFAPVDTPGAVEHFLEHWKPNAALWVESELWPNLLAQAQQRGVRMMIINGRMSERSFGLWQKLPGLIQPMLSCFQHILAQSDEDAARFVALGANRVSSPGNLKYDAPPLPVDDGALEALKHQTAGRTLWLAASTHPGEEAMIADIHHALKQTHPLLLTIIVPRHAVRGDAITAELRNQCSVAQRSKAEPVTASTDIYLADTMGELGVFYRLSDIAFMGGSLVPHGGQNALEAARLDAAIILGPHMENFAAITREMEAAGAAIRIQNPETLAQTLAALFADDAQKAALQAAARNLVASKRGIRDNILNAIGNMIGS